MNKYLYEEQLKNERFEMLINTKVELTKEEADFILSWDPTEHENIIYVREGVFLNANIYSEHDNPRSGLSNGDIIMYKLEITLEDNSMVTIKADTYDELQQKLDEFHLFNSEKLK